MEHLWFSFVTATFQASLKTPAFFLLVSTAPCPLNACYALRNVRVINKVMNRSIFSPFTGQKDNASRLFRSFRAAWDLVHHHLSSQGTRFWTSFVTRKMAMQLPSCRCKADFTPSLARPFAQLWNCTTQSGQMKNKFPQDTTKGLRRTYRRRICLWLFCLG